MKLLVLIVLSNLQKAEKVFSDNTIINQDFLNENPLGYNSQNMNSFYKDTNNNLGVNIKALRFRGLTHDALEDAFDNAKLYKKLINKK